MTAPAEWRQRAAALAESLIAAGAMRDKTWQAAFLTTPRHMFIPHYWERDSAGAPAMLVDSADARHRDRWLDGVYQDRALVTRWAESTAAGAAIRVVTELAPAPSTLAVLLDRLGADDGHRVLEVGTGSGYGTALLAARCGSQNVASVGDNPVGIEDAAQALARTGHDVQIEVGNGFHGLPARAPYDRIVSTRAVSHVPSAWIAQLAPGGRIVLPLTFGKALAILDKIEDQEEVVGVVDRALIDLGPAPRVGDERPLPTQARDEAAIGSGLGAHKGTTDTDPRWLEDEDVRLWISLHLPGVEILRALDGPHGSPLGTIVYSAGDRATVSHRTINHLWWPVAQEGRRPWDHVEAAVRAFQRAGRPGRDRLGIGAGVDGAVQRMWLDDPGSSYSWPLPTG